MDVRWGDISLVEAELYLFKAAAQRKYAYYHLLSGQDLPLHNMDYLHDFFEGKDNEYIGICHNNDVADRVYLYHYCTKSHKAKNHIQKTLLAKFRRYAIKIQKALRIKKRVLDLEYAKGAEWVSVTHNFVTALLNEEKTILWNYRHSNCPDEVYKQTFAYNSDFKNKIFDTTDEYRGCMREIDWNRGNPYVWRKEDFPYLAQSDKLFARKFDCNIDDEIIEMIYNKVKNE